MPSKLQFVPPQEKNPISIQFNESYKRKEKAYINNYLKIEKPDNQEERQMKHWAIKAVAKPEHIKTTLIRMWKVKLKEGQFEDADSNIVTGPNAPKVGFHYLLHEMIDDPKSREQGNPHFSFPLSDDTFTIGKYTRPKFHLETNSRGDISGSKVVGGFPCHYIEFNEKTVLEVLDSYEKNVNFSMGVIGDDLVPRTVHNMQEFLEGTVDDLAAANKGVGGVTYLTKDYGGLNRYIKDKEAKLKEGARKTATDNSARTSKNDAS